MGETMSSWTIYFSPIDHPGLYVVREFFIARGTVTPSPVCKVAETLGVARGFIPDGMARFAPQAGDDPSVVESYL